jgi:hypothetical protein
MIIKNYQQSVHFIDAKNVDELKKNLTMTNKLQKTCGSCVHFKDEDIFGDGWCEKYDQSRICINMQCSQYLDRQQLRHHIAVLLQHNRWRRDNSDVNARRMVNPTELGKAIDFAIKILKEI